MGVVRNFIDVIGITAENDLPKQNKWQMMVLSESDYIFLPEDRVEIDTIYQIIVDMEIKSTKILNLPIGRIQVLDAVKKFKILYSGVEKKGQVNILNLSMPLNTFIELFNEEEGGSINVYILDAFFELIDRKKIYYHLLFMLDVQRDTATRHLDKVVDIKSNINTCRNLDFRTSDINDYMLSKAVISVQDKKDIIAKQIYTESAFGSIKDDGSCDIDSEYL